MDLGLVWGGLRIFEIVPPEVDGEGPGKFEVRGVSITFSCNLLFPCDAGEVPDRGVVVDTDSGVTCQFVFLFFFIF